MTFEKAIYYNRLYDYYYNLLTDKQREVFTYYFQEDLSYQEIAEILGVSRSAIFDSLKRVLHLLDDYENKLGIASQYQKLFNELYELENEEVNEILKSFDKGGQNE